MTVFLCILSALANPIGKKAPDFKLRDTQGATHQLSQYEGKVVVLECLSKKGVLEPTQQDKELEPCSR